MGRLLSYTGARMEEPRVWKVNGRDVWLAAFLSLPSISLWLGLRWPRFFEVVIAWYVVVKLGWVFHMAAKREFKIARPGINMLISIGTLLVVVWSTLTWSVGRSSYFGFAIVFMFVCLLVRWIKERPAKAVPIKQEIKTQERFEVTDVVAASGVEERLVLSIAASLVSLSHDPMASALLAAATERSVHLAALEGDERLVSESEVQLSPEEARYVAHLKREGKIVLLVVRAGTYLGAIAAQTKKR